MYKLIFLIFSILISTELPKGLTDWESASIDHGYISRLDNVFPNDKIESLNNIKL